MTISGWRSGAAHFGRALKSARQLHRVMAGKPETRVTFIPHEDLGVECCGLLMVETHGEEARILCNECGIIIRTIPVAEAESALAALAGTQPICTALCACCGALNTFPGWTSMAAFVCSECGQAVTVDEAVQ